MSKNREIHPLTIKEALNVFKSVQTHDSRHYEVILHPEARWLSRGKVLERVFQLWQELRVFLAQQRYPISTNFQSNFWLYLNLNSVSRIVQPFSYEEIVLGFSHVAAIKQKTAGHSTRGATRLGQGGFNSPAPSHYGGAQRLRRRGKVPTMSQVLSSIQNVCFRKTSVSNMEAPNLLLALGAI